jgi:hypothetical protein
MPSGTFFCDGRQAVARDAVDGMQLHKFRKVWQGQSVVMESRFTDRLGWRITGLDFVI